MSYIKIEAYQTEDGEIFKDMQCAARHDKKISLRNGLERLVATGCFGSTADDVIDFIEETKDELLELLSEYK